ncbi:MAG: hypothetical protein AAB923_03935, partial [Patescibacteria group bacterium]
VVSKDETETGPRMVLNFGHTVGHALEKLSHYRIPHGAAVALGILVESRAAAMMGFLADKDRAKVDGMIAALDIGRAPLLRYSAKDILQAAQADKKSAKGHPRYIVLTGIGKALTKGGAYAHAIPEPVIARALSDSR